MKLTKSIANFLGMAAMAEAMMPTAGTPKRSTSGRLTGRRMPAGWWKKRKARTAMQKRSRRINQQNPRAHATH